MPIKFLTPSNAIELFKPDDSTPHPIALASEGISAGFPSPAEDHNEQKISLDKVLVKNKEATFYAKVSGQSMIGAGLDDGDLLIVDRSQNPEHNKIAVCFIDGEFTEGLKRFARRYAVFVDHHHFAGIKVALKAGANNI